jgi:hypothetical protein
MRNSKASGQPLARPQSYSPSVPISLYREVTAELQTTKASLEACQAQNQQLLHQNQQLRQEMQRIAQLAMHTHHSIANYSLDQHLASSDSAPKGAEAPEFQSGLPINPARPKSVRSQRPIKPTLKSAIAKQPSLHPGTAVNAPLGAIGNLPQIAPSSPNLQQWQMSEGTEFMESRRSETRFELSGWKLGLALTLIVITAFGAGFLIVRPLLNSR